ncbi:HD domain-containing protein [Actinocorallia herbida]|uniref:HD domain-containing protein n=1 Tax=Actinocorallia herbida TaxID=58109 RepID=UPI002482EF1E|nr:HD domain-containing protein [Actinocorallia herbida]
MTHPRTRGPAAGAECGTATICAALLHDVVEDTDAALADVARASGAEVAALVDGLPALDGTGRSPADRRILRLKLFDRLHNMRTIGHVDPAKRIARSRETLEILVPTARVLGLGLVERDDG